MSSIYICLATDNNYVQLASVALESILENNEFVDNIEFFILDSGINKNNKDIIRNQIENKSMVQIVKEDLIHMLAMRDFL